MVWAGARGEIGANRWRGPKPGVRCFHRFPMRREAAWGGEPGLPHGTMWRVTARFDSAPVVGARHAFWHPVRGAGVRGGGVPGVFASLDPRLISVAPSGHFMRMSWAAQMDGVSWMNTQRADTEVRAPAALEVDPVEGGLCLGAQRRDKPRGLSPRGGKVAWQGEVKRSPTGFRTILAPVPRVAAGAATRGYGSVPLQGTCGTSVVCAGGIGRCLGASTSQLTLGRSPERGEAAQPGVRCFHRFPMRGEAAWSGERGLPHGTTLEVTAQDKAGSRRGRPGGTM
jgi:hypothetical protein